MNHIKQAKNGNSRTSVDNYVKESSIVATSSSAGPSDNKDPSYYNKKPLANVEESASDKFLLAAASSISIPSKGEKADEIVLFEDIGNKSGVVNGIVKSDVMSDQHNAHVNTAFNTEMSVISDRALDSPVTENKHDVTVSVVDANDVSATIGAEFATITSNAVDEMVENVDMKSNNADAAVIKLSDEYSTISNETDIADSVINRNAVPDKTKENVSDVVAVFKLSMESNVDDQSAAHSNLQNETDSYVKQEPSCYASAQETSISEEPNCSQFSLKGPSSDASQGAFLFAVPHISVKVEDNYSSDVTDNEKLFNVNGEASESQIMATSPLLNGVKSEVIDLDIVDATPLFNIVNDEVSDSEIIAMTPLLNSVKSEVTDSQIMDTTPLFNIVNDEVSDSEIIAMTPLLNSVKSEVTDSQIMDATPLFNIVNDEVSDSEIIAMTPLLNSVKSEVIDLDIVDATPLFNIVNDEVSDSEIIAMTPLLNSVKNEVTDSQIMATTPLLNGVKSEVIDLDIVDATPLLNSVNNEVSDSEIIAMTPLLNSVKNEVTDSQIMATTPLLNGVKSEVIDLDIVDATPLLNSVNDEVSDSQIMATTPLLNGVSLPRIVNDEISEFQIVDVISLCNAVNNETTDSEIVSLMTPKNNNVLLNDNLRNNLADSHTDPVESNKRENKVDEPFVSIQCASDDVVDGIMQDLDESVVNSSSLRRQHSCGVGKLIIQLIFVLYSSAEF